MFRIQRDRSMAYTASPKKLVNAPRVASAVNISVTIAATRTTRPAMTMAYNHRRSDVGTSRPAHQIATLMIRQNHTAAGDSVQARPVSIASVTATLIMALAKEASPE